MEEIIDLTTPPPPIKTSELPGLPKDKALDIFNALLQKGFAVSVKHLGGHFFVEIPVGLRGDPAYQQQAVIQTLASNAGCKAIQTGETMRIIG